MLTRKRINRMVGGIVAEWEGGKVQGLQRVLEALLLENDWDHLLLALCNIATARYQDRTTRGRRRWHQRARSLHDAFERERARSQARKALAEGGAS